MGGSWKSSAIGEIAEIVGGSTPSTKNDSNFGGNVPWLTPRDLSLPHGRYVTGGERNLSQEGLASCSARLLPRGAVLLTTRAPIGYVAIAGGPISTNQGFRSLILREGYDPEFVYYWLSANVPLLERHASGSTFKELSGSALKRISIRLPEEPAEQRAIAHILGTLDDKIELNRRMNATLEGMARALFKSWFVDFDPVRAKMDGRWQVGQSLPGLPAELYDLFPDRLVESELGELPEGWEVRPIGELVTLSRDAVTPSDHPCEIFDHFSIPAYDEGATPKAEGGSDIKSNKYLVSDGSVLLSKLNPRIPRVWLPVVGADRRSICSTEFLVVEPAESPDRSWIYCLLVSSEFRTRFGSLVTGTSGSHQRVRPDAFMSLKVPVAPGGVRLRFAATAGPIQDRIAQARGEAQVLASLRDTLLPRLISGDLRIKDAERLVELRTA